MTDHAPCAPCFNESRCGSDTRWHSGCSRRPRADATDDALVFGEVELLGTFKLGAWHHTENGNGYYAIVDRQLERYLGVFTRAAVAPDRPIELYIDTGIRIGPGRSGRVIS